MKNLTKADKELLNKLIDYINNNLIGGCKIVYTSSIIDDTMEVVYYRGVCSLVYRLNTNKMKDNVDFINKLYQYAPKDVELYNYWFDIKDFKVRIVFLRYVRFLSRFNIVIRFNYDLYRSITSVIEWYKH